MQARLVSENIRFQRGIDPKDAMGIGVMHRKEFRSRSEFEDWLMDRLPVILGSAELPEDILGNGWVWMKPEYVHKIARWLHNKGPFFDTIEGDEFWFSPATGSSNKIEFEDWVENIGHRLKKMGYKKQEQAFTKVNESINFERGIDPKAAMGIGIRESIKKWMAYANGGYEITEGVHYIINPDQTIDILTNFETTDLDLIKLPDYINFRDVKGDFMMDFCRLETLRGMPKRVDGFFSVEQNNLTSLDHFPKLIGSDIFVRDNPGQFTRDQVIAKIGTTRRDQRIYSEDSHVDESINFERGMDPKRSMGIGRYADYKYLDEFEKIHRYCKDDEFPGFSKVTDIIWGDWPSFKAYTKGDNQHEYEVILHRGEELIGISHNIPTNRAGYDHELWHVATLAGWKRYTSSNHITYIPENRSVDESVNFHRGGDIKAGIGIGIPGKKGLYIDDEHFVKKGDQRLMKIHDVADALYSYGDSTDNDSLRFFRFPRADGQFGSPMEFVRRAEEGESPDYKNHKKVSYLEILSIFINLVENDKEFKKHLLNNFYHRIWKNWGPLLESVNFKRGQDPRDAMDIGKKYTDRIAMKNADLALSTDFIDRIFDYGDYDHIADYNGQSIWLIYSPALQNWLGISKKIRGDWSPTKEEALDSIKKRLDRYYQ